MGQLRFGELSQPLTDALSACRSHLAGAAIFSFFLNLLFLAPALYMLQVYDRVVATGGTGTLLYITLALAIALLSLSGLDAVRSRLLVRASARLDALLAPLILKRMMGARGRHELPAMRDFDTVRQALASPAAAAVLDAPFAPIFILVCFMLHFWIGVLAVGSVALLLAIAYRNQQRTRMAVESGTRALAAAHTSDQTTALHSGVIRALGMSEALIGRRLAHRSAGVEKLTGAQFEASRFTAISRFVRLFVQSASLGLGALLAIAGEISAGAIIAGSILLGRALQPVDSLIGGWSSLGAARAALGRLSNALREDPRDERVRTVLPAPDGRVEVDQLSIRGPDGRPILYNISLQAIPGEILGIVGPSGSGKSTLAKAIVGIIEPDIGTVRIDGARRCDWPADALGRHLGYLPQEPSLFEGTIKENICRFQSPMVGDAKDVDSATVEAAKAAEVHELILKLPQGYDTTLGPLGSGLSAGQAQRVALARALYGNPNIFVLDEPNASLDAEGEAALLRTLEVLRGRGATIVLIAHRRSVLQGADRLLVLEAGRAKMAGPTKDVVVRLGRSGGESAA